MGGKLLLIPYFDNFDFHGTLFSKNASKFWRLIPNQAKLLEHFYGCFHRPLALLIQHLTQLFKWGHSRTPHTAGKAGKVWFLPIFWVSIRSYKKQQVKKFWCRILDLVWHKFAVAVLDFLSWMPFITIFLFVHYQCQQVGWYFFLKSISNRYIYLSM